MRLVPRALAACVVLSPAAVAGPREDALAVVQRWSAAFAASDVDTITALDHAAFGAEWWYSGTTFFRAMHDPTRFIVVERNGLPVGYGFGHAFGAQAHITRLAVHPEQQGQGIGTRLLEALIIYFRAQGAETITLNTQMDNEDALRLYRHFGFTSAGDMVTVWRTYL